MSGAPRNGWLVGPGFDGLWMVGPAFAVSALALVLPEDLELGGLGWLLIVVGIDVAHVWSTLYRTYADPGLWARHRRLLVGAPVVAALGALALVPLGELGFWRALAYFAAFHFVRQHVGVGLLYRARSGEPMVGPAALWERAALYAGPLVALAWWHASLPRGFAWFLPGDFVAVPRGVAHAASVAGAIAVLGHLSQRVREQRTSWARDLWWLGGSLAWLVGVVATNGDLPFTLTNVVSHGVPYVALVGWTAGRQWQVAGRGAFSARWFTAAGLPALIGLPIALALAEEALWDWTVWGEHPEWFGEAAVDASLTPVAAALLSVPQLTHYLLDGFIWKADFGDPPLRTLLRER